MPTISPHPPLRIRLLGPVAATLAGEPIDLGGGRQRAVLAAMALEPNRVVALGSIIDSVWGDETPATAKATVQSYVSRLRKAFDGSGLASIEGGSVGYALRLTSGVLDIEQFDGLVDDGRRALSTGVPALAAERFAEALDIWRGPPLADLDDYTFARNARTRLERDRLTVTGEWIEAQVQNGESETVIADLEALVAERPLHEPFYRQLMIALYRADRQADALAAYRTARTVLLDQLGIEPSPALADVERGILQQDPSLLRAADPPRADAGRREIDRSIPRNGLVGRDQELADLVTRLEQLDERGGLVVVSGPAGIGKTALLSAFADVARVNDTPVRWGRTWEGGEAPAFWPWIEVLRQWAAELGDDGVRRLAGRRLEHLARLLPEFAPEGLGVGVEQSYAQFALYEAIAGVLVDIAGAEPFVIVLDDLQWADASSIELLKYLAARLDQTRLLVVASRRDPAANPAGIAAALRSLEAVAHDLRLPLGPLGETATSELVRRSASLSELSGEAVAEIVARSEGLPFFAVELARALRSTDADRLSSLPTSVRESIMRRVEELDVDVRELLQVGAVAGDEFSLTVVGRATDLDGVGLLATLEAAISAGVLQPVPGRSDRYRFEHALVREALVGSLGHVERLSIHSRLASALASSDTLGSERLLEQAHHALEAAAAMPTLGAVDLAEAASQHALRSFGYEEAAGWLDRAAPVVAACGDRTRSCDLLLARGDIENRAGWAERAKATHLEAADLARELGSGPLMARAVNGHSYTRMDIQVVDAVHLGLCAEASEMLDTGDSAERALLFASWGNAHYWGDAAEGRQLVDEAVEMARRVGDAEVLGACLRAAAWLAYGDGSARVSIGQEMLDIARRTRDVELELWGHRWVHVGIFDQEGPTDRCRASLATYFERADQARQPHHLWFGFLYRANFALIEGNLADAEQWIDEAFAVGQVAEPISATQYYGAQMFALRWLQGRMDELIPLAEVTVTQYPAVHTWRALLAYLYAATDQSEKARQRLVELEAIGWDDITSGGTLIMAHGLAAEAAVRSGCADIGEVLLPRVVANGDQYVHMAFVVTMGSSRYFRARLLGLLGHLDEAVEQMELAVAADVARRLPPLLVRDHLALAELLEQRGASDDTVRAADLRADATAAADELEMQGLDYL